MAGLFGRIADRIEAANKREKDEATRREVKLVTDWLKDGEDETDTAPAGQGGGK